MFTYMTHTSLSLAGTNLPWVAINDVHCPLAQCRPSDLIDSFCLAEHPDSLHSRHRLPAIRRRRLLLCRSAPHLRRPAWPGPAVRSDARRAAGRGHPEPVQHPARRQHQQDDGTPGGGRREPVPAVRDRHEPPAGQADGHAEEEEVREPPPRPVPAPPVQRGQHPRKRHGRRRPSARLHRPLRRGGH